ncbi:MAG: SDR family oxidoreductase [Spirochaetota bacterium]|nr:SDR family oxidoreductase [Spirochaetota bacterium]
MGLDGKVAIVTASAGAGIGQAIVRRLAQDGANIVVVDTHERRTKEVTESLKSDGHKAIGVICDVSKSDQVENMTKETLEAFGRIDILVNNAGREVLAPIVETTEENWDLVINVCLKGTFLCTKSVLPTMISQKGGNIVNIASVDGYVGSPVGECSYCSAKAGIMAFTRVTAAEYAQHGVRANCLAPGFVPNPFLERIYSPEMLDAMAKMSVLGRGAKPEEMASIVAFLVSEDSSYLTGEVISASGGLYWRP